MSDKRVGIIALVLATCVVFTLACRPWSPPSTTTTTGVPCTDTTLEATTTAAVDTTTTETTDTTLEPTTTAAVDTTTETTDTTLEPTTSAAVDTTTTETTDTTLEPTTTTAVDTTTTETTDTTLEPTCDTTTTASVDPETTTSADSTTSTESSTSSTVGGSNRPNILVVMTDDQGCDQHASRLCDMVEAAMPFLAGEPGGGWYVAQQARTHNSLCCPNRATVLTGQTNLHNGVLGNNNCKKFSDVDYLPTALQQAGYATGHFGKFLNCYPGGPWQVYADGSADVPDGWDRFIGHNTSPSYYGFDVIDDGVGYPVTNTGPDSYETYWFKDRLIEWLETRPGGQPWFAYFTPYAPHSPATPAPDWIETSTHEVPNLPNYHEGCPGATDPSIADKPTFIQDNPCTGDRGNGKGAQWGVDRAFEDIYAHLEATDQLDNTAILFLGDNGMALGSHRINSKTCAYEECHTIPFMLRVPGLPGGDIDRMISNLDVTPTLLELAGATTSRRLDGQSILPLLTNPGLTWRDDQFLWNQQEQYRALREDCAVHDPCWFYTEYENGERELYDLRSDPFQLHQLLPNPATGFAGDPAWTDPADPRLVSLQERLLAAFVAGGGTTWP